MNAMGKRTYISVILPLKLGWEPCYWTDIEDIAIGQRVTVQFAGKSYTGTVSATGIEPSISPSRIMEISNRDDNLSKISRQEIEFWRRLAEYYMCTIGEVYSIACPVAKINSEKTKARKEELLKAKIGEMISALERKEAVLESRMGKKAAELEKCRSEEKRARLSAEIDKLKEETATIKAERQRYLSSEIPAGNSLTWDMPDIADFHIELSHAQKEAMEQIEAAFGEGKTVLLNGVAGSGKTEIYTSLAAKTLQNRKNVLYLVPEKAMSRQLSERLEGYFGNALLTFHSGKTAAQRAEIAETIRSCGESGKRYIVLGTRSSLFLPHHDLGLVIVDEEHDSSYKQDSPAPRYNARDAAIMLGTVHSAQNSDADDIRSRCNVILGSATPSLESIYNCLSGKFAEARLSNRYYGDGRTDVEIIDTIAERKKNGMTGSFSKKLVKHISDALGCGQQVMLLRTRRGYSLALQCTGCGYIPKCPKCNVSLTYHKDKGRLECHHCGFSTASTGKCPECGEEMKTLGAGTQKIEEEAATLFPGARIARLDSDTARSARYEAETIKSFSRKEIDILVGTQIVSKGFDFGNLALTAVMQADTMLGIQDFRADEKAMQTLLQFKGRCGRRGERSLFVIQTAQPEHPVYKMLSGEGQAEYISRLLAERAEFNYPPFTRIVDIILKDRIEERAERMAKALAGGLLDFRTTGPYAPAAGRRDDEYSIVIRVTLSKDRQLAQLKKKLIKRIEEFESANRYNGHICFDADPI